MDNKTVLATANAVLLESKHEEVYSRTKDFAAGK